MRINALSCVDHLLESLDKMLILDDVLPFLTDITCQDPDVIVTIVSKFFDRPTFLKSLYGVLWWYYLC